MADFDAHSSGNPSGDACLQVGSSSQFWTRLSQGAVIAISSKQLIIFIDSSTIE
jgi:hypothetical protein